MPHMVSKQTTIEPKNKRNNLKLYSINLKLEMSKFTVLKAG